MADLQLNIPVGTCSSSGVSVTQSKAILIGAAECNSSGLAPFTTFYPPFHILNEDEDIISYITLDEVYPGMRTPTYTYTIQSLIPGESVIRIGSDNNEDLDADEYTSLATFLSLDEIDWGRTIDVTIPAYGSVDFYMYHRPPSTAPIKNYIFALTFEYLSSEFGIHQYYTTFEITSQLEEDNDEVIRVYLTYESGKMETDFSDIKFYRGTELLKYTLIDKTDGVDATYNIAIPDVKAGKKYLITICSGNSSDEYIDGLAYDEGWNWRFRRHTDDDEDISPWSNVGYLSGDIFADLAYMTAYGNTVLRLQTNHKDNKPIAETESEAFIGHWSMRYNFGETNWNYTILYYRPIIDSEGNYYEISIDFNNSKKTIYLKYNDTILDSHTPISYGTDIRILDFTRDVDGNMTVSLNGVEYLSANDTNIIENTKTQLTLYRRLYARSIQVDYIYFLDEGRTDKPIVGELDTWRDLKYYLAVIGKTNYDTGVLPDIDEHLRYGVRINGVLYE